MDWRGITLSKNGVAIAIPFTKDSGSKVSNQGFSAPEGETAGGSEQVSRSPLKGKHVWTVNERIPVTDSLVLNHWATEQDNGDTGLIQVFDYWQKISATAIGFRNRAAIVGTTEAVSSISFSHFTCFAILDPNGDMLGEFVSSGGVGFRRVSFLLTEV